MAVLTRHKKTSPSPAAPAAPAPGEIIHVQVKPRPDAEQGMYEVQVQVDDHNWGSSFVLTSPRNFAFRKVS